MSFLVNNLMARVDTPERHKFIKYSMVSVFSFVLTVSLQFTVFGLFHPRGEISALVASGIAAFPSYFLNRQWVWGKSGRSHMRKEVIPFWIMVFVGLGLSMLASGVADRLTSGIDNHALRTIFVVGASAGAFGFLWIAKFVIFNKILFIHHEEDLDPALDGRSGFPT